MKLRTTANSIRLRLSQTDVKRFTENGMTEEVVRIGMRDGEAFSFRLQRSETARQTTAIFADNCLTVSVPFAVAKDWAVTDAVGIEASQPLGDDSQLSILIEKDFACLTPRLGDDDKDSFPHPDSLSAC